MEHKIAKFGCFFGFLSIFLYYISPLYGSWWFSLGLLGRGMNMMYGGDRLNAFGAVYTDDSNRQILGPIGFFAGLLTLTGSFLLLFGIINTNKIIGLIGGILISTGPLLFLLALHLPMAEPFYLYYFREKGILFGGREVEVWGSDFPGLRLWSLGPGFYIALAAGILGIIGAAILSDEDFS